jgi:Tol biopolymer transport system component
VRRCVADEPQSRWRSVAALLDAVRPLQRSGKTLVAKPNRRRTVIAAAVIAVVVGPYNVAPRPSRPNPSPYQKIEGELPSFSPDGNRMALITVPEGGVRRRITVRDLATGKESHYSAAQAVKWSPDGSRLAFVRGVSETLASVFVLDLKSGAERELFRRPAIDPSFSSAIAWSADSRAVISPFLENSTRSHSLWAVDIGTGQRTRLTRPSSAIYGDIDAALSTDGKRLAFVRAETTDVSDAYWKDVTSGPDGPVFPLTSERRRLEGVEWLPGDREVVFASRRNLAKSAIWKVAASTHALEPALLQAEEGDCAYPAVVKSPRGGLRLAYWRRRREANIYLRDGPDYSIDKPVATGPMERYSASISSDGERIAFNSNETGNFELYLTDSQGSAPFHLTLMGGPYTGSAQWSPDRQRIAFESSLGSNRDIFVIPAVGGVPTQFTIEPSHEARPFWSRDGKWIYYRSNRSGPPQIWRKPSNGGEATQITRGGGADPIESIDGKTLYYVKSQGDPGIWTVPVKGGDERMLIPGVHLDQWAVTSLGILYLDRLVYAVQTPVKVYNPVDGSTRALTSIPCANYCVLFTATPDAKRLVWGAIERDTSDLRLVDLP